MRILLYTILNCKGCAKHLSEVKQICVEHGLDLKVYDVDSEKHFLMVLSAMRRYKINTTPAIVLIKYEDQTKLLSDSFDVFQGIDNSITELKERLNEP